MTEEKRDEEKVFFGAESYYQWLKAGVLAGDMAVMEKMIEDVNAYARPQIRSVFRKKEDVEDVLQNLDLRLWTQIAGYVQKSDEYHPYQRQSWLKTLILRSIVDYQRELLEEPAGSLEEEQETRGVEPDDGGEMESRVHDQMHNETLNSIILDVCSMRISGEKMLTFFYHNIVFFVINGTAKNGKPQETRNLLAGKTLGQLRDALPLTLKKVTGCEVDQALFRKLDEKLEGHREDVYGLDADEISVTVSSTKKRLVELKKREEKGKKLPQETDT